MLPLADQVENLQNFTLFCRTIIEVQKISRKARFEAWKVFHTLFGLYYSSWEFRRDCRLPALGVARVASKVSRTIWGPERKELEEVSRSNIEQFEQADITGITVSSGVTTSSRGS